MRNKNFITFLIGFGCIYFLMYPNSAFCDFLQDNVRIDTDPQNHSSFAPQVASDDGSHVYVVWKDDRPDNPSANIYFNKSNNYGVTWLEEDIPLDYTGGTSQLGDIQIGCDNAGHVYIAWIKGQSGQDAVIKISDDYGQTWQTHQLDIGGASWESNMILNLDFDYTENGNVCAVWDGGGNDDEIYINCSSDYGQTWMPTYNQVNSNVPYPYDTHRDPKVAVDTSGRVYVIWLDNRGATGGEMYIYANRSLDLGQTWSQDIGFYGFANGVVTMNPQIDCDNNGNVYTAWQQYYWPNTNFCLFRNSLDAGNNWSDIETISFYSKYPKIIAGKNGLIFYAYLDAAQADYQKIKFTRSLDHGVTWQNSVQVSNSHDVETNNIDVAVKDKNIYVVWENNEPWQGIYFSYSANSGATWQSEDIRVDDNSGDIIPTSKPALSVGRSYVYAVWEDERNSIKDIYFNKGFFSNHQKIQKEARYILSCQYLNPGHPAHGAINNIYGTEPTWIVPRENALAILGLIHSSGGPQTTVDHYYQGRADKAMDYLLKVQDKTDGAWHDQYSYEQPVVFSKSPTQTAEVMMAMFMLGFREDRYKAMRLGAKYLLLCQQHGFGGLVCGGKQENGQFHAYNWASDNSFAYLALKAARGWALKIGEEAFATECDLAAENILNGINQYLYHDPQWEPARWHQAVDENGNPVNSFNNDWINYAPYMLDLPVSGINPQELGQWIHDTFQLGSGGCIGPDTDKQYPGLSFQASFCWLDAGLNDYANQAIGWSETSGLWQEISDPNGISGGWIDWISVSNPQNTANWWERFIDTSFYAIAAWSGGYDFTVFSKDPPGKKLSKSALKELSKDIKK